MKFIRTNAFKKDFKNLPVEEKKKMEKALRLLMNIPSHPSLHIKKTRGKLIKGYSNIFEGRIDRGYRFLFLIKSDSFILLRCGKHDEFFK